MPCQLPKKLGSESQLGCNCARYPPSVSASAIVHHSLQPRCDGLPRLRRKINRSRQPGLVASRCQPSLHRYLRNGLAPIIACPLACSPGGAFAAGFPSGLSLSQLFVCRRE
jgi:hypothetical protein